MQDTVPEGRTVPGFGPPASRGVLSRDGAAASGFRSSGTWNDRVVEADWDLASDQRVQAINRLGRLVECSGFDESQDRAEFGYVLCLRCSQFHVAISSRLAPVSLPRLDALSELLKVTASDLIGKTRAGSGDHGQPPSRNWAVDPSTYTSVAPAQPVKSCWDLGPFHSSDGARIVGSEAALRRAGTACSTGRGPSCDPT